MSETTTISPDMPLVEEIYANPATSYDQPQVEDDRSIFQNIQGKRTAVVLTLAGVVAAGAYHYFVPSEIDTKADKCTDATHTLFVDNRPADPDNWSDLPSAINLPYPTSEVMWVQANPALARHDKDGKLVESIGETTEKGVCLNTPAPVIGGYDMVQHGETKESIASSSMLTVEALNALNPQIAGLDPSNELQDGSLVRVSPNLDASVVLQTAPGTINEISHGNNDMRLHLLAANAARLANGEAIQKGDSAYFPLQPNKYYASHHIDAATVPQVYMDAHTYDGDPLASTSIVIKKAENANIQPNQPSNGEAQTLAPETVKPLSEEMVQKMFAGAKPEDVQVMYADIMQALKDQGINDPDMALYTFANIRAEVGSAKPIKEYGGDEQWYAPWEGRGYLQLTLEGNYENADKALHIGLLQNPDLALDPHNAAEIAVWYMKTRESRIRAAIAKNDLTAMRIVVNGINRKTGLPNGLDRFTTAWQTGWDLTHAK